jgi:Zn-dependent protease
MPTNITILIFEIIVLVFSAIIHEYMHGWMADQLGDPTAKQAGRLTLNPLPHLDLFGSFLLPLLLVLSNVGIVFGWAKPVPFNPYNLRDKQFGPAKVAIAGPLGNLITAVFFGLLLRFLPMQNEMLITLLALIVQINLVLMIFNLVPIPPLDGSKVLAAFLPYEMQMKFFSLEKYGMIFVIIFITFGFTFIVPIINFLFKLIVGGGVL